MMNKYTVFSDGKMGATRSGEPKIVFLNPDHIVSAVVRKNQMRYEATLTDTNENQYVISHPDYDALMHIIMNGQGHHEVFTS